MSEFKWNPNKDQAALMLAQGYTNKEVALSVGVVERTIERWRAENEFMSEVDRLTLMSDIAGRAERLRIAMRAVRQGLNRQYVVTNKDVLDWLKFVQSETDGAKLDLTALLENYTAE